MRRVAVATLGLLAGLGMSLGFACLVLLIGLLIWLHRPKTKAKRARFGIARTLPAWQSSGMSATKVGEAQGTRTGRKARPEAPWNVVLHNSWHPMSWVVYSLTKTIPGTTIKRATKIMWEAHTKGRAVVTRCHKELAELYEERLRAKGLSVEPG